MSFLDFKPEDIKEAVRDMAKKALGLQQLRPQGVLYGIIETCVNITAWIYTSFIFPMGEQSNVKKATGAFLDSWGALMSVERKPAQRATGKVTITVYRDTTIPSGRRITVHRSPLTFFTTEEVSITKKQQTSLVPVQAEAVGARFNLTDFPADASINPLITGVDTVVFQKDWKKGAVEGADEETDEPYRDSIMAKWSKNAAGDVPLLYVAEAQGINGVKEAKVFRTPGKKFGSLRVVCRGAGNTRPDDDMLQKVRDRFDTVGLIARIIHVEAVGLQAVTVRISYKGALSVNQVREKIIGYFNDLSIGTKYTIQGLFDLFDAKVVRNMQFKTPTADDTLLPKDAVYDYHNNIVVTKEIG